MARLGPGHGRDLQEAVAKFWRCEGPRFENRLETYRKLHKNTSYFVGDSAVKRKMVTKIERTSVQRTETNEETAASGTEEMLRTSEIRFAHNDNHRTLQGQKRQHPGDGPCSCFQERCLQMPFLFSRLCVRTLRFPKLPLHFVCHSQPEEPETSIDMDEPEQPVTGIQL